MSLEKYFSRRHGYKETKVDIQLESMDIDLTTAIWNIICSTFLYGYSRDDWIGENKDLGILLQAIWSLYYKNPMDEYPYKWGDWKNILKDYLFSRDWYEVYDILEFMIDYWPKDYQLEIDFIPKFNEALERENSGFRIINNLVTPITNDLEIGEIEDALESTSHLRPVSIQIEDALQKLSDRENPDYRGSIKDSISAVETLCRILSDDKKITLGKALDFLENESNVKIHGALRKGFSNLYGWTSDAQGIRHALMDEPSIKFIDAKYMLVSCSAFINYLIMKAGDADIDL